MIGILPGLAPNVIGFKASGEVTGEDYEKVVFPEVKRHLRSDGKGLNFVFYVETPPGNFTIGAWIRDLWLGLKEFSRWHRVAIISELEKVRNFTDAVSMLLPGEYKGFAPDQLDAAVRWAATEEQDPDATAGEVAIPAFLEALLPAQVKGTATTTSAQVKAKDEEDAKYIFERTCERLLNINQWSEYCSSISSFQLVDNDGEPLQGSADIGDFIRIDLPGPGGREGDGYDWVQIEKIEFPSGAGSSNSASASVSLSDTDKDINIPPTATVLLLQVRPSRNPCNPGSATIAHFLEGSATSTFLIVRNGDTIRATIYGRNETPNTAVPGILDKWRNAVVGSAGAIGLSKLQWKALVEGLLKKE